MAMTMEYIQNFREAFEFILESMQEVNGKPVSEYDPKQLAEYARNAFRDKPQAQEAVFPGVWKDGKLVWEVKIALNRSGCVSWRKIKVKYQFL